MWGLIRRRGLWWVEERSWGETCGIGDCVFSFILLFCLI